MQAFLRKLLADQSGASAAEYALILVIISLAVMSAALALSSAIGGAMSRTASCIENGTGGSCR